MSLAHINRSLNTSWLALSPGGVQPRLIQTESQAERTEKRDWKGHLLCMLEAGGEYEMAPHKRVILDWVLDVRSRPEVGRLVVDFNVWF